VEDPRVSQIAAVRPGVALPGGRRLGRLEAWASAADAGETQWGAHRSRVAAVACWSLVGVVLVGAWVCRTNLGPDAATWMLLTAANALALGLAIGGLRQAEVPPVMFAGVLAVFLIGGIFQLYVFSYNVVRSPVFITSQAPFHGHFSGADVARAYELVTLGFVLFCLMAAVLVSVPVRMPLPRFSNLTRYDLLTSVLVWSAIGYAGVLAIQMAFRIGQAALYNRPLPFHLVTITLFYQRHMFPALLLLGLWVFDGRKPKSSYACLVGMGLLTASVSFAATSRGAILRFGMPVVFLWLLMGRFTKLRKLLVVGAFLVYLVSAPVLSTLRVTRVHEATGVVRPAVTTSPFSGDSLNYEMAHLVFRVGGTGSLLFAQQHAQSLSIGGLGRVIGPEGLTDYYTHEVVGLPVNTTIKASLAPTLIGMGTMVGGAAGLVVVLALTVLGLDQLWRWMARRLWTWPVAVALLAGAAVGFFSEGVPVTVYKTLLSIGVVEVLYRLAATTPPVRQAAPAAPAHAVASGRPVSPGGAERRLAGARRGG
jgi:hypothetical protein